LGSVVVLTLALLRLPAGATSRFKLGFGSLFVPLFGLAASERHLAEKAGQAVLPRRSLAEENERLRRENEELKILHQETEAALRENLRLRTLLGWSKASPWKVRLAHVIARDPANWWRTLHIDLGRRDGIRPEAPVLTAEGLVGRVAEVSETRSRVLLLGDPNCRVAALVLEGRQAVDTGIISGGSSVTDLSMVDLTYLSRGSGVKPGQSVVTSGLGGVFTNGIRIGQVVDSHSMEYGLYTDARVRLAVNLSQLEEVWVMMP
jgi:rod shape-determining protein MreC